MCPACMASAALMAGSVISTGGIAALAVKVVRWKNNDENHDSKKLTERRNDDGNHDQQDGAGGGGVAR
jgi:hypothetical protein